ncbi:MAG: hypothetical protein FWF56_04640 [Firmicutes bacterium]|nr:hypothetical protein [Bacillota bacterium]MCL1953674.1 hypothetical protein [Bacillota bacterium]
MSIFDEYANHYRNARKAVVKGDCKLAKRELDSFVHKLSNIANDPYAFNRDKFKEIIDKYRSISIELREWGITTTVYNAFNIKFKSSYNPVEEARQRAEEAEAKQQAEEAEEKQQAEEAEEKQRAEEAEARRQAEEVEARRQVEEAEARRQVEEAEARQQAEEAEARRQAEEAEEKQRAEEAEARRQAEEAEVKQRAEEVEARRQAEEDVKQEEDMSQDDEYNEIERIAEDHKQQQEYKFKSPEPLQPSVDTVDTSAIESEVLFVLTGEFYDRKVKKEDLAKKFCVSMDILDGILLKLKDDRLIRYSIGMVKATYIAYNKLGLPYPKDIVIGNSISNKTVLC